MTPDDYQSKWHDSFSLLADGAAAGSDVSDLHLVGQLIAALRSVVIDMKDPGCNCTLASANCCGYARACTIVDAWDHQQGLK